MSKGVVDQLFVGYHCNATPLDLYLSIHIMTIERFKNKNEIIWHQLQSALLEGRRSITTGCSS